MFLLATRELGARKLEIVVPSLSVLAEPTVAVVEKVAHRKGTAAVAQAYLEYLYSPEGQDLAGKHHYRPRDPAAAANYASQFTPVDLFTVDEAFGGWSNVQKEHFDDGAIFDQIYIPGS